jgi:hypothetical protein
MGSGRQDPDGSGFGLELLLGFGRKFGCQWWARRNPAPSEGSIGAVEGFDKSRGPMCDFRTRYLALSLECDIFCLHYVNHAGFVILLRSLGQVLRLSTALRGC